MPCGLSAIAELLVLSINVHSSFLVIYPCVFLVCLVCSSVVFFFLLFALYIVCNFIVIITTTTVITTTSPSNKTKSYE